MTIARNQWTCQFWAPKSYNFFCGFAQNKCVKFISHETSKAVRRVHRNPNRNRGSKKKIVALPGAIEANRNHFIEQRMVPHYFLNFLGCDIDIPIKQNNEESEATNFCQIIINYDDTDDDKHDDMENDEDDNKTNTKKDPEIEEKCRKKRESVSLFAVNSAV